MAELLQERNSVDDATATENFIEEFDAVRDKIISKQFEYEYKVLWVHSPAYEKLWRTTYGEYLKLEEKRKTLGIERQEWQDDVEEMYQVVKDSWDETFTDIDGSAMKDAPLGYTLYDYQAANGQAITVDRLHGWRTALNDWDNFGKLFETSSVFRADLSSAQAASFEILNDWWNSRYCPPTDLNALRAYLDTLSSKGQLGKPLDNSEFSYEWVSHSHYHSMLLELFVREFHPMEWEPYARRSYLLNLKATRTKATQHAMNMRFAYATITGKSGTVDENVQPPPRYPEPVRDMAGWKGNMFFEEQPLGAVSREGFDLLLDMHNEPPKYLWNVAEKKAVRVTELSTCPEYLCISHTWGRFCHRPPQWVSVPGVRWPVKTNSLYDVRTVPDMLPGFGAEYVWLDLFCLPQEESPEHHEEVANQTAIFRRAKACVAWLNEVETWTVTRKALEYIGASYLRSTCSDPDLQLAPDDLNEIREGAEGHSELLKPGSTEPAPWFSSLWTLQETALCPNLQICTKHMEVLKDNLGTPISMTTLFSLVQTPSPALSIPLSEPIEISSMEPQAWPNGVKCIRHVNGKTRLGWLLTYLSPMDIMVHANYRVCKRSRAPAIMSALGVLDWYKDWAAKDDVRQNENRIILQERKKKLEAKGKIFDAEKEKLKLPQEPLVLETFPIEFVHEAARKIGSSFYNVLTIINTLRVEGFEAMFGYGDIQIGSMMPFTKVHGWDSPVYAAITIQGIERKDHESVAGWEIMPNGSVLLSSVGILVSSTDKGGKPIDSLVMIPRKENGIFQTKAERNVDLQAKLEELAGTDSIYYAVTLADDLGERIIYQSEPLENMD
ncbi:hypothetical protein EsH8_III_000070 [Colletotrichum jinshuiense]